MENFIEDYFTKLKSALNNLDKQQIINLKNIFKYALDNKKTIYIIGNGGSSAIANHFVCDFVKDFNYKSNNKIKIVALTDNISTITAYANDVSFEDIFLEQLKVFMENGDVILAISGSGNSINILKAVDWANKNNGITFALTGFNGGKLKEISKYSIDTNIDNMGITQDIHSILVHLLVYLFQKEM